MGSSVLTGAAVRLSICHPVAARIATTPRCTAASEASEGRAHLRTQQCAPGLRTQNFHLTLASYRASAPRIQFRAGWNQRPEASRGRAKRAPATALELGDVSPVGFNGLPLLRLKI